jgi:hypothetical protein
MEEGPLFAGKQAIGGEPDGQGSPLQLPVQFLGNHFVAPRTIQGEMTFHF